MNEQDGHFLGGMLAGLFSRDVNPPPIDQSGKAQIIFKDVAKRNRFRELLQAIVTDPQPSALAVVQGYVLEAPESEEEAEARLHEIWEQCFGPNGILTDEALSKVEPS